MKPALVGIVGALLLDGGSGPVLNGAAVAAAPLRSWQANEAPTALLASLAVRGLAPITGYSRARFGPAWADTNHNGCDTRDDILARDLVDKTFRPGSHQCVVLSGRLFDPYNGKTFAFRRGEQTSSAVEIDHVVALGDAWRTGAAQLSAAQRELFANDPLELLAVDGPNNDTKGDSDAAGWLPPNVSFRCAYVTRQIDVKAKYHLWVTAAEHDVMARVLAHCGAATIATTPSPTTAATAPASTTTVGGKAATVTPGAFCSVAGASGTTTAGTTEVCRTSPTDPRLRWRARA